MLVQSESVRICILAHPDCRSRILHVTSAPPTPQKINFGWRCAPPSPVNAKLMSKGVSIHKMFLQTCSPQDSTLHRRGAGFSPPGQPEVDFLGSGRLTHT